MNNAVVIGWGTVGKSTALAFGIRKYYSRSEANVTLEEASQNKYIFLCLPTPTVNGECKTDDIYDIIKILNQYPDTNKRVFINRSTVSVGFGQYIQKSLGIDNYVSNPEFLSEDTWEKDAERPQLVIIGADNLGYGNLVKDLYQSRYKYMEPVLTTTTTAELIKYTVNTFFATKVVFANQIYDYAQKVGANYITIKGVLERHPWGSKNHFDVFSKGGRGAGGKCLPKDLEAFERQSKSLLLQTVRIINQELLKESNKK